MVEQMDDIRLLTCEEVVDADHVVTVGDKPFAEVAAEEAGTAGDQDSLQGGHVETFSVGAEGGLAGRQKGRQG
jgi:hypothetical protein